MGDPTRAADLTVPRWRILALLMGFAALCHFNRISISVAGTERIIPGYHIDPTVMGVVYTAYLVVYTVCMTPGGWLIDRLGPRAALLMMGAGSALFVALTGLAGLAFTGPVLLVAALLVIRALLGLVSVPMHPGAARVVSFWVPASGQARANGLVNAAALVGIASTYSVFGAFMDWFDWPGAFLVSAGLTALLALLWMTQAADRPAPAERAEPGEALAAGEVIPAPVGDGTAAAAPVPEPGGVTALLRNRSLVLLTLSYAAVGYFQYLFFYWMQYYFDHVLQLGKDLGRLYAAIPNLAMALGMFLGGWLADAARVRYGPRRGRMLVPVLGMAASALLLGLGLLSPEPAWIVTCFTLAMGALGTCEGPFWATAIDLGGRRGGTSAAIFNTGGNAGGLLAPVVTPLIAGIFDWKSGLGLAGVFCLTGAALWFWIDPNERTGGAPASP